MWFNSLTIGVVNSTCLGKEREKREGEKRGRRGREEGEKREKRGGEEELVRISPFHLYFLPHLVQCVLL